MHKTPLDTKSQLNLKPSSATHYPVLLATKLHPVHKNNHCTNRAQPSASQCYPVQPINKYTWTSQLNSVQPIIYIVHKTTTKQTQLNPSSTIQNKPAQPSITQCNPLSTLPLLDHVLLLYICWGCWSLKPLIPSILHILFLVSVVPVIVTYCNP